MWPGSKQIQHVGGFWGCQGLDDRSACGSRFGCPRLLAASVSSFSIWVVSLSSMDTILLSEVTRDTGSSGSFATEWIGFIGQLVTYVSISNVAEMAASSVVGCCCSKHRGLAVELSNRCK